MHATKRWRYKPVYRIGERYKNEDHESDNQKCHGSYSGPSSGEYGCAISSAYFHPLFLLYLLGIFLFLASIPFLVEILKNIFVAGNVTPNSILVIYIFLVISGLQSWFFAMWMDIQDNDRLQK